MSKGKGKFRVGQVVMVTRDFGTTKYPVKLDHQTRIGTREGIAWMDSLDNVEYEADMRKLTRREAGRG
jgi:hypothetical protein